MDEKNVKANEEPDQILDLKMSWSRCTSSPRLQLNIQTSTGKLQPLSLRQRLHRNVSVNGGHKVVSKVT